MEVPGEEPRFSISDTGIGVDWDSLTQITNLNPYVTFVGGSPKFSFTTAKGDKIEYLFQQKPFRIVQYANGNISLVGNAYDTLTYAAIDAPHEYYYTGNKGGDQIVTGYEIGMSFVIQSERLFGVPQRAADQFSLPLTTVNEPLRLFNYD